MMRNVCLLTLMLTFGCGAKQQPSSTPTPANETINSAAPLSPDGAETPDDSRKSYGKFVRHELITENPGDVATFYSAMFGWQQREVGDQIVLELAGREVARIRKPADDQIPAGWMSWISVEDIDDLMRDVEANGGKILRAPADVVDGRAAVLEGPTGGVFGAIQLTEAKAEDQRPIAGDLALAQLWTSDYPTASVFYKMIGNYTSVEVDFETTTYSVLRSENDEPRALVRKSPGEEQSRWIPFVLARDVDERTEEAKQLGARVITAPRTVLTLGRLAVVEAPGGGVFGLISANVWDAYQ